jgi:hypothetical protein
MTITRLARADNKATSVLSLDLLSKIVSVLDCGIEDPLEVVEGWFEQTHSISPQASGCLCQVS